MAWITITRKVNAEEHMRRSGIEVYDEPNDMRTRIIPTTPKRTFLQKLGSGIEKTGHLVHQAQTNPGLTKIKEQLHYANKHFNEYNSTGYTPRHHARKQRRR